MRIISPSFIFFISWAIVIILCNFGNFIPGKINILTNVIVGLGILIFCIISYISKYIKIGKKNKKYTFKLIHIYIYIISNGIIIINIAKKILKTFSINRYLLGALRYHINYEGFSFGITGYLMVFMINLSIFVYVLYINEKIKIKKINIILFIVVSIFYLMCFTNRLNIVLYIGNLFLIYTLKNKFKIKKFLMLICSCFIVFYSIGKITKKMENLKDVFVSYFLLGYKYLDSILQKDYEITYGAYTFQIVNKVMMKIGMVEKVLRKNILSEDNGYFIVSEKLITNVPTMYGRLISDFGIIYVYILVILFSILTTIIYRKAREGQVLSIYFYSYIGGYLFFTIYDEMFFRIIPFWIQIILSGYICDFIFKKY